jgi:hypothetical protein
MGDVVGANTGGKEVMTGGFDDVIGRNVGYNELEGDYSRIHYKKLMSVEVAISNNHTESFKKRSYH